MTINYKMECPDTIPGEVMILVAGILKKIRELVVSPDNESFAFRQSMKIDDTTMNPFLKPGTEEYKNFVFMFNTISNNKTTGGVDVCILVLDHKDGYISLTVSFCNHLTTDERIRQLSWRYSYMYLIGRGYVMNYTGASQIA